MLEKFSGLLFELSHEDRLKIFQMIQKNPLKLTHLSEKLNLQIQETSRHLSRLSDEKLILKDVEGFYHITPYGDHVMRLLPGFEFLSNHRNFFLTHKSTHLPGEFVSRVGELNKSRFTNDIMVVFQEAKALLEEANEYIWNLSDHITTFTTPLLENAMKRGVGVKLLLEENIVFPPGFQPISSSPNRIEIRTVERADVDLILSEKKTLIAFPTLEERIDHTGFIMTDEMSHKWCKELFEYYWARAKVGTPAGYPKKY